MGDNLYKVTLRINDFDHTDQVRANTPAEAISAAQDLFSDADQATDISVQLLMSRKEAVKKISELTSQARRLIDEACVIADQADVDFSWSLEYGMGGHYMDGEWHASSQSC